MMPEQQSFMLYIVVGSGSKSCSRLLKTAPDLRPLVKCALQKNLFAISQPKHVVSTQKNCFNMSSFEHPKHMLKMMGKKILKFVR